MDLLVLNEEAIRLALDMSAAIEAMKCAFAALSEEEEQVSMSQRTRIRTPKGVALLSGAAVGGEALAAKVLTRFAEPHAAGGDLVQGLVLHIDPESGTPDALLDGAFLTVWRTAAAAGAATDLLARRDVKVAAVVGAGRQARTQVLALDAVRELEEIRVTSRRAERALRLAEEVAPQVRARVVVENSLERALDGAGVVSLVTSAREPVLFSSDVPDGVHVNAIGALEPEVREVDGALVGRSRVFVDEMRAALAESGDLLLAEREGHTRREDWTEVGEVVLGRDPGRRDDREVTLFESVGVAAQDAVAAAEIVRSARALGLGTRVRIG